MTAEGTKDVIRNLNGRITNKIMVNNNKKKDKKDKNTYDDPQHTKQKT